MSRENRGIEVLDYATFNVLLGGVGNVPKDNGIKVSKTLFAPRLGAGLSHQRQDGVPCGLRPDLRSDSVVASAPRLLPADDRLQPTAGHEQLRRRSRSRRASRRFRCPTSAPESCTLPPNTQTAVPRPEQCRPGPDAAVQRDGRAAAPVGHLGQRGLRRHADGRRLRGPEPELLGAGRRRRRTAALRTGRHRRHPPVGRRSRSAATTRCRWRSTVRSRRASC